MKSTKAVSAIVSLLGGPEIPADDLDWALDLPAGQKVFEWLVSQVKDSDCESDELPSDELPSDAYNGLRVVLQAISLEEDEVQMLRNATRKASTSVPQAGADQSPPRAPSGYIPPWRIRAKEQYLVAEAARLETDTEALKARLQQTKIASQSLTQAIKFLASEIEKTDTNVLVAEERLSEFSLQADATVLASVNNSLELLDGFAITESSQDEASLSTTSSTRAAIIHRFQSQMHAIDAAEHRLPTPDELRAECARLTSRPDAALTYDITNLCQALEHPDSGRNALAAIVAGTPEQRPRLDVAAELEAAWARDQENLLDARGTVLDDALAAFSDVVLPPLATLRDNLAAKDAYLGEAQALVGALREEIQDARATQKPQEDLDSTSAEESKDAELQAGLESLLKELKDLRPHDAPPLVLLTQDDILSELRGVYEREEGLRRQEEAWVADLLPSLRNMEAAHAPLLDAAYAHSPMNTSPPFALHPDITTAHADARSKADDLGGAIDKLQEDVKVLTGYRAKRRMGHFVAKWAK
ncbi:hypothetical protein C8R47DRAFT_1195402 [Mycena vitilis]|nr:hypothetical protein C8R47DRAFT_1195402 [Mycena vitilis]